MRLSLYAVVCTLVFLTGCQLKPTVSVPASDYDKFIATLPQDPAQPPEFPSYQTLYQSYLASPAARNTTKDWLELQQLRDQSPDQCRQLPWEKMLVSQFWNLTFHQQAISCFELQQNTGLARQFSAYRQYVLNGMLASGNGKASYSAYQINSFFDAHQLVQQLGMQTIDFYGELSSDNNALHYVFHVYDLASQKYQTLYFENQHYLHVVDSIPYPFMGLVDGWKLLVQNKQAQSNLILLLPQAADAVTSGELAKAVQLYRQALAQGSLHAAVKLAELCYLQQPPATLAQTECQQQLVQAADNDYLPALHLLNYLHHSGQFGQPEPAQLQELRDIINQMAGPGQAELQLSRYYYNQKLRGADTKTGDQWLQQAGAAGLLNAQAFWLLSEHEQQRLDQAELNQALQRLADQGSSVAAYLYASQLLQQPAADSAIGQQAERYLLQASQEWHPEALFLLAHGYENRLFGAHQADPLPFYQQAAARFYPRAMLRLGNLYRHGDMVPENKLTANRWFLLCSKQGSSSCAFNAGVMFDDGEGVEQNYDNAWRFYSYAAGRGYAPAINRLALLYLFGHGVKADCAKALELLTEAAAKGSVSASYYLGLMYFDGQLVARDYPKAKSYFEQAHQHPNAQRYLQNWQQLTNPTADKAGNSKENR